MSSDGYGGWTDARVSETVTASYINSHLRSNEQELLKRPLYYGGDLTDDTYLDWISTKARLFFLILVATGVPDQIFGIVDDAYDDDDLPIAEDRIADLRLSNQPDKVLDRRFYKTQFKYLTRQVGDGEHIRYADEETVPVVQIGRQSLLSLHKDSIDYVKLGSDSTKVFVRKSVNLDNKTNEMDILMGIAEMKKFSHEHILSIYGSYLYQGVISILSSPAAEYTLKLFLSDVPKSFEVLPKSERHKILINWPHCLASAVSWLHGNGGHHGAIRPSNIHVSRNFEISLGYLEGPGIFCVSTKADDIESYQYAAPERWKRAVTVQSTGSAKMLLPSGGRTAVKQQSEKVHPNDPSTRKRSTSSEMSRSQKAALEYAYMPTSMRSEYQRLRLSTAFKPGTQIAPPPPKSRHANMVSIDLPNARYSAFDLMNQSLPARSPSALALKGPDPEHKKSSSLNNHSVFAALPETRSAVVQTWISVQHDSFAADIFSLGAVIFDILTLLCKKSHSSFVKHRAAKNRNAGRGGGLADASFHANLGQVLLWAKTLSSEAEKKARNSENHILRAVGPITQVALHCLERNPELRPKSQTLEVRLVEHMKMFAEIDALHCEACIPPQPRVSLSLPMRKRHSEQFSGDYSTTMPTQSMSDLSISRTHDSQADSDYSSHVLSNQRDVYDRFQQRVYPEHRSKPVLSSYSEHSTAFDLDIQSDTTLDVDYRKVASATKSQTVNRQNVQMNSAYGNTDKTDHNASRPYMGRSRYSTESLVDPQLMRRSESSTPGEAGVFSYMNYSNTPSDDEEDQMTRLSNLDPGRQHIRQTQRRFPPNDSSESSYYNSVVSEPESPVSPISPATSNTTISDFPKPAMKVLKQTSSQPTNPPRGSRTRPSPSEIAKLRQLARQTMSNNGNTAERGSSMTSSPILLTPNNIKPFSTQQLHDQGIMVIDVDASSTANSSRMGAYETIVETDEDEHQIVERDRQVEAQHRLLQQQQRIQVAEYLRQQQEMDRPRYGDHDPQRLQKARVIDLRHGAYNGNGKGQEDSLSAGDEKKFISGRPTGMSKSRPVIGPSGGSKDRVYRTGRG